MIQSNSTSNPVVSDEFGPALFTVAYVSTGKWKLTFEPSVDITTNAVYLVVTYEEHAGSTVNVGNMSVTAVDSTMPVYAVDFPYTIGNNSYTSQRIKILICNSTSYYIAVGGTTSSRFVRFEAYYTGVSVS